MADMENRSLEIGDVISLDDENGELLGDFEVIATFDLNGKPYVALTPAEQEEADEESVQEEEEEIDIYVFRVEGEELVPLEAEEEQEAYSRLDQLLEDIELIDQQ